MKNINKITYSEIKKILLKNNIKAESIFSNNDEFSSLNSIIKACNTELTFFSDISQLNALKKTNAKACLINQKYVHHLPKDTKPILVDNIYNSFAIISNLFVKNVVSNNNISELSFVTKDCFIDSSAQVDPFTIIKDNCQIGKNVIIESNCTIGPNVIVLENTIVKSNSTLMHSNIGSNCIIKSGTIIGGVGFGFDPISRIKIQHFGNVIIKNNCHIGSNTTIDRAVFESTVISENSFIDNLVQIAHNVEIGKGAIIAAQTGIAGSTKIGDNLMTGGQVGIAGHLNLGNNVRIAAKSGVTKNIKDNSVIAGFPAIDIKKWKLMKIKEANNL